MSLKCHQSWRPGVILSGKCAASRKIKMDHKLTHPSKRDIWLAKAIKKIESPKVLLAATPRQAIQGTKVISGGTVADSPHCGTQPLISRAYFLNRFSNFESNLQQAGAVDERVLCAFVTQKPSSARGVVQLEPLSGINVKRQLETRQFSHLTRCCVW